MLTDVPKIDQKTYQGLVRFAIRSGGNLLVLGPSGGGKTIMAQREADKLGAKLIYINLAVLERPDFQGLPVLSDSRDTVHYATPDFLPFADADLEKEIAHVEKGLKELSKDKNKALLEVFGSKLQTKLDMLNFDLRNRLLMKAGEIANIGNLEKLLEAQEKDKRPIVFLFDEVDKASTDTTQTLLEVLQFHSVNGRKLNIKSCILTGNLPDEHAHTNNISHAITKRCQTYQLDIDPSQWKDWAYDANINEKVVSFLIVEPSFLYRKAADNDPTAYAMPSPRTWESAARLLDIYEESDERDENLEHMIVCGNVGVTAGVKFMNWMKYFHKMDPLVKNLLEKGEHPKMKDFQAQEMLVFGIQACTKCFNELKPKNQAKIDKYHKNVYGWLASIEQIDVQMASVRLGLRGDFKKIATYNLAGIPEFKLVFDRIREAMNKSNIDLSKRK